MDTWTDVWAYERMKSLANEIRGVQGNIAITYVPGRALLLVFHKLILHLFFIQK